MFIVKNRKIFYWFSGILIAVSILATSIWGINLGIDFTGGSLLEIHYENEILDKTKIQEIISGLPIETGDFSVRPTEDSGYIIRTKTISDSDKEIIMENLSPAQEVRFNTIGPTLGKELTSKAVVALLIIIVSIILFVAFAFREVSRPVSSWKYGLVAIIAFIHDVSIPIGVFAFLGQFWGVEVDTLFVVAILVVLGYSINDTIIIFDRIRENLKKVQNKDRDQKFEQVVGKSLIETIGRSVNTSFTTLIALFALLVFGGDSTQWFALALIVGILAGTYSSIFFAAPMLVSFSKKGK